jgi:hypothetical protein
MGNEPTYNSVTSRTCWALVLWLSRSLDEDEREAVLGDLAESSESPTKAFRHMFGLVLRRQAAVWRNWRLWFIFAAVLPPLSLALCAISQSAGHEFAVYTWMYANNSDWALLRSFGFWYVFAGAATGLLLSLFTLACWSWCAGFLLGGLGKEVLRTSKILMLIFLAACQFVHAPQRVMLLMIDLYGLPRPPLLPDPNAPVTAIALYQLAFPWIVLTLVVALPALWGMQHRKQALNVGPALRTALISGAIVGILAIVPQVPGFGLLIGASGRQWLMHNREAAQKLSLLNYWAPLYVTAVALAVFARHKIAGVLRQS